MKRFKIISILLVLVLLLSACGGKTETPSGSGTDKPSGTQTPAVPLSPSNPSTGKTDTPKTDDPAQAADIYESLVGTWVAVEGETEGYRYDAPADGVIVQVEFMPNHVAIYKESSVESDTQVEYYYGIFPEEGPLYGSGENWHMDLHDSEYSVQKSVSMENGRLIMDLQGDYIMGGTLFFEKVATKMLAQVTVMEAGDYNTADDGSFKPDPGWFENVVASVELSPRNPADTMYWQLIEAKEDKVRVCLEENYDGSDFFSMILYEDDSFAAVSNQGTVILNKGEILAVKASEPWICEYRAWLSKDEFWGSFEFESHREVKDGAFHAAQMGMVYFVTGHNKELEHRTVRSTNYQDAMRFLEGSWVYLDQEDKIQAVVRFDHNGNMQVINESQSYEISYYMDHIFAGDNDPADLICLWTAPGSQADKDFGMNEGIGDYYFEVYPVDGEEILALSQVNNGDALLGNMMKQSEDYMFVLHRYEGTSLPYTAAKGAQFVGNVVKYDVDNWLIWIQPQEVKDHMEDGSNLWGRSKDAVVAYEPASADMLSPLFYNGYSIKYPMLLSNVVTNSSGQVTHVGE